MSAEPLTIEESKEEKREEKVKALLREKLPLKAKFSILK